MTDVSERIVLARVADVPENDVIGVTVRGVPMAVYNVDGTFHASDDICNHGQARLSEGFLDGDVIECPLHGGCFNVASGKPCAPPVTDDMKVYSVAVDNGEIILADPSQLSGAS
ncbi:MAG: non-heme iron oxygenase ferredoxin subunit [Aquisalimonadaceae bacterium]